MNKRLDSKMKNLLNEISNEHPYSLYIMDRNGEKGLKLTKKNIDGKELCVGYWFPSTGAEKGDLKGKKNRFNIFIGCKSFEKAREVVLWNCNQKIDSLRYDLKETKDNLSEAQNRIEFYSTECDRLHKERMKGLVEHSEDCSKLIKLASKIAERIPTPSEIKSTKPEVAKQEEDSDEKTPDIPQPNQIETESIPANIDSEIIDLLLSLKMYPGKQEE